MTQKFVVRLLTVEGELIGWTEHHVEPVKGRFYVPQSKFVLERPGLATQLTVEWSDLDIARYETLPTPVTVPPEKVGTIATYDWLFWPLWQINHHKDAPRPAVTVRGPVTISPGPGAVAAIDPR